MKNSKKLRSLTSILLIFLSVTFSADSWSQQMDYLGSRKVFIDLHLDMVRQIDDLKLGYTPDALTIKTDDITPDLVCVALAMELSMDALNSHYFVLRMRESMHLWIWRGVKDLPMLRLTL